MTRLDRCLVRFGLALILMTLLAQLDLSQLGDTVQPWWQRYGNPPSSTVDAPRRSEPRAVMLALRPINADNRHG